MGLGGGESWANLVQWKLSQQKNRETAERSFPSKLVSDPQNGENLLSLSLLYQFQPYVVFRLEFLESETFFSLLAGNKDVNTMCVCLGMRTK